MKLIVAYIQPYKLSDVKDELLKRNIVKMSISNSLGCGQQGGYHGTWRGLEVEVNLLKKTRIEIAVNEKYVDKAVEGIIKGAQTGKIGDGKIFIFPIERCIRIRNEETGHKAIG